MAGIAQVSHAFESPISGRLNFTRVDWVSDASGNVTVAVPVNGVIQRVTTKPGTGGTQPSDLYDMTLSDQAGFDVLAGQGANLSNASVKSFCPVISATDGTNSASAPIAVAEDLSLSISNAGAGKTGTLILHHR